jgi:hypothetical protein
VAQIKAEWEIIREQCPVNEDDISIIGVGGLASKENVVGSAQLSRGRK